MNKTNTKNLLSYKIAYNILMDYFEELSEESKEEINLRLKNIGF